MSRFKFICVFLCKIARVAVGAVLIALLAVIVFMFLALAFLSALAGVG